LEFTDNYYALILTFLYLCCVGMVTGSACGLSKVGGKWEQLHALE